MNKSLYNISIISLLILVLFSCSKEKHTLKLLKVSEHSTSKVNDTALKKILNDEEGILIDTEYTLSEDFALEQLKERKVDLVIIPNNITSNESNFKTIIPLLPRFLMILTNHPTEIKNLNELFNSGTIYFEDQSRLDSLFFKSLYYNFNIDENKIQSEIFNEIELEKKSDSLKIYVGLTHLDNPLIKRLTFQDWSLFSLGNVDNFGKGSKVEGFTMMNMSVYPFIIPMHIYKGKPEKSILTIAIKDILIARSDLSNQIVYNIVEALNEHRSRIIQLDKIFNLLDFDFEKQVLSFPLHDGARHYLDKNEPPVWSKYVKMIWPLISISVVVFGILVSFRNRFRRRKKQNIEMYYNSLLDIRDKSEAVTDTDTLIEILKELKGLRSQAMKSLADKKLDSGESFNIFLALYNDTKNDLVENLREIRLKDQENKKA